MDYHKLVSVAKLYVPGRDVIIDTKGLLCRIKVLQGSVYMSTEIDGDAFDPELSASLENHDEIDFIGKLRICSCGNNETYVRVMYFDRT